MGGGTVYLDVMFAINLVMDYFILWTTGKLVGVRISRKRTIAAAVLGATYSIGTVIPHLSFMYSVPYKLLFSGLMVLISFWPSGWHEFLRLWAWFYGVGFAMAGAVLGLSNLFQDTSAGNAEFSYVYLSGGVVCALLLGYYGDRMMRERIVPQVMRCPVRVRLGTTWIEGQGFVDTGNNLMDPLTNKPVVIAEQELLDQGLPEDVKEALSAAREGDDLFESLARTSWASRLRLIPFTSIGKKHGLLVGLRSDEIAVEAGSRRVMLPGIVIGLYQEKLSPEGKFQMLLPASIFEN